MVLVVITFIGLFIYMSIVNVRNKKRGYFYDTMGEIISFCFMCGLAIASCSTLVGGFVLGMADKDVISEKQYEISDYKVEKGTLTYSLEKTPLDVVSTDSFDISREGNSDYVIVQKTRIKHKQLGLLFIGCDRVVKHVILNLKE